MEYYSNDLVTLYHGDCTGELLPLLGECDVLITDPPYGIDFHTNFTTARKRLPKTRGGENRIAGDRDTVARDTILDAWGGKPALVFGSWKAPKPRGVKTTIQWCKTNIGAGGGDLRCPWGSVVEEIYVLGGGFVGKRGPNFILHNGMPSSSKRLRPGHPTPKPVSLIEHLLDYVPEDWVVCDPFAGSGAVLRACQNRGRRCVGIELVGEYCELAKSLLIDPKEFL